VMNNFKKR